MSLLRFVVAYAAACGVAIAPPVVAQHVLHWTEYQAEGAELLWLLALGLLALVVQLAYTAIREMRG